MPVPPPGPLDDRRARPAGLVSLRQPLDEVAAEPAGARGSERRDDDLVDALVVDRLHGRGERIGMRDLAVRRRSPRRATSRRARFRRRSASGWSPADGSLCGEMMRKPPALAAARARIFAEQRLAEHRLVRDDEHVRLVGPDSPFDDDVLDRQRARRASASGRRTSRRSQPDFCCGMRRDDDLVARLELAIASRTARRDRPRRRSRRPRCPSSRRWSSVRSRRRRAAARRVSS